MCITETSSGDVSMPKSENTGGNIGLALNFQGAESLPSSLPLLPISDGDATTLPLLPATATAPFFSVTPMITPSGAYQPFVLPSGLSTTSLTPSNGQPIITAGGTLKASATGVPSMVDVVNGSWTFFKSGMTLAPTVVDGSSGKTGLPHTVATNRLRSGFSSGLLTAPSNMFQSTTVTNTRGLTLTSTRTTFLPSSKSTHRTLSPTSRTPASPSLGPHANPSRQGNPASGAPSGSSPHSASTVAPFTGSALQIGKSMYLISVSILFCLFMVVLA